MDLKIGMASRGQTMGLEDVMMARKYTYSVKCIEEGTMYHVMNREFLHRAQKDEKAWKQLELNCKEIDKALMAKI